MGVVYLAKQTEPTRRSVALKLIKVGMDTNQVVARFEAERLALALMDHSSIIYLMGQDGSFVKHFAYTTDVERLTSELKEAIAVSP